ncbi:MAG: RNA-binding protein [Deltaproteobacteria bacterium]|nr:MAG: RNA-binding protein [Deltaproteobacteria bacterium]
METEIDRIRIDKWLWTARFFKTRALASKAVSGGKVHLNGQRVKAARLVQAGDQLEITKGIMVFNLTITGINKTRRPAKEARQLYVESEESIKKREETREFRKMANAGHVPPSKKPGKRDRRKIKEFIRKL